METTNLAQTEDMLTYTASDETIEAAAGIENKKRVPPPSVPGKSPMITLYSYPKLFGVADNNGYGLKVFAFLRLDGMQFKHEHVFDASAAPRGQLPYIVDDDETIGDSNTIIAHLSTKYRLTIDARLTAAQRDMSHLINRLLDDLYWVMSYSRWKDERFWPAFRDALLRQHPSLTETGLRKAQEFNFQRDSCHARSSSDLAHPPPSRRYATAPLTSEPPVVAISESASE